MPAPDYNYMEDLVVRAQGGDNDAFAKLYAATCQKQYHFAYSYLKDEYLAQDALQETYIIALKNISRLKNPMLVVAWLNQINFRICFQLHKKQKRYNLEMIDYQEEETDPQSISGFLRTNSHFAAVTASPEDLIVKEDSRKYIMNQILRLPFKEAQAIILKFYRNLKHDEIAAYMNVSKSSVKRYLNSGKTHLAKTFQQQGDNFTL